MANKVFKVDETTIIFGSEVGDDVAWSTESIANGAGRQSALHDLGAGSTARSLRYHYRFHTQCQATATLEAIIELKMKTSDGTHPDNDDGTGDAAVSAEDKLLNLTRLIPAIVDEAAANIEYVSQGVVDLPHRHVGFVFWNRSGATITADAAETKLHLTPMPPEIQ